jgi:hypothetical protein
MKIKKTHWLVQYHPSYNEKPEFSIFPFEMTGADYATVKTVEIEMDIPDDFDPRPQQIAALEGQRKKAMADHEALMNMIEGRIQSLRAIEHIVTEEV